MMFCMMHAADGCNCALVGPSLTNATPEPCSGSHAHSMSTETVMDYALWVGCGAGTLHGTLPPSSHMLHMA